MNRLWNRVRQDGLHMRTVNVVTIVLAVACALALLHAVNRTYNNYQELQSDTRRFMTCERAANELQNASNYLTTQVRMFAITRDAKYIQRFFTMVNSHHREDAVETLRKSMSEGTAAYGYLEYALQCSDQLVELEYRSMRLIQEAENIPLDESFSQLANVQLSQEELALSPQEKLALGQSMVTDDYYQGYKDEIYDSVDRCIAELVNMTEQSEEEGGRTLKSLLWRQQFATAGLFVMMMLTIATSVYLILKPLSGYTERITAHQPLKMDGAFELRYLAKAYNRIYEENQQNAAHLKYAAEHDPLTGLLNRGAFDKLYLELTEDVALLHVDIDYFRDFNNTYGHDMGDRVLKKVSGLLSKAFRSSDFPFRTGGDEFVVIMTGIHPGQKEVVRAKIEFVRKGLQDTSDGMLPITLSIGVAFSGQPSETGDLYKDADIALYKVKEKGKNGYGFYGE